MKMYMLRAAMAVLIASTATTALAQSELHAADTRLNALYKQIQERLSDDAPTLHLLTATQRSWIAFRDAECAFSASSVAGGSAYPAVVASCRTDLTEKRIADFNAYLKCQEGDLACPVPRK